MAAVTRTAFPAAPAAQPRGLAGETRGTFTSTRIHYTMRGQQAGPIYAVWQAPDQSADFAGVWAPPGVWTNIVVVSKIRR